VRTQISTPTTDGPGGPDQPTVYTEGPVAVDDLRVGDVVAIPGAAWTLSYGPIVAIRPYLSAVAPRPGWRYAVFANGVEVTMTPGSSWFPR